MMSPFQGKDTMACMSQRPAPYPPYVGVRANYNISANSVDPTGVVDTTRRIAPEMRSMDLQRRFQGNLPMFPFGTEYLNDFSQVGRLAQRDPLPPWVSINPLPLGTPMSKDPKLLLFDA